MKIYNKIIGLLMIILLISCEDKLWTENYDINFPTPMVQSIDKTTVEIGDTLSLTGYFEKVSSATIGNGFTKILKISEDFKKMQLLVTETCASGKLVIWNLYKQQFIFEGNIFVIGTTIIEIPEEIVILDFSRKDFIPKWTASTWVEAKPLESEGYDLNEIDPPVGYSHFYSMNDTTLFPPNLPIGQGGNVPYGNYTYDNNGNGFDISPYEDPYVSVLINTGNDIAYFSLVIDDQIYDFDPSHSPGGKFANGEKKHYMKTDNKWLWYSFSLKKILGSKVVPTFKSAGLFIRNSWDYGADIYPGFQLNIVSMVVTEGPLPSRIVLFDFEDNVFETNTAVPGWAGDFLTIFGIDKAQLVTVPSGKHYFSMINHHNDENGKNYKFGVSSDNGKEGWNFSNMKYPCLTFAVNTGEHSGFVDFIFYQAQSGNKDAEPWADPGCNGSAVSKYSETETNGFYYDTKGKWEWRTYDLVKLLNGVETWGLQNGAYPDFKSKFDYVTIWPRDGWNNENAAPRYEVSIDYVIVTDGLPTGLPELN